MSASRRFVEKGVVQETAKGRQFFLEREKNEKPQTKKKKTDAMERMGKKGKEEKKGESHYSPLGHPSLQISHAGKPSPSLCFLISDDFTPS